MIFNAPQCIEPRMLGGTNLPILTCFHSDRKFEIREI